MVLAGFTFFAWFVALNTISPAIPEGLQGTAKLFMILSAVTGLGFLVSGGMTFFGHDQYVEEQRKNPTEKNPVFKPLPKPLFSRPAVVAQTEKEPEEDVTIEVGGEKKKEDEEKKEGWDAPSKTGWG